MKSEALPAQGSRMTGRIRQAVLGSLLGLALLGWFFREPVRDWVAFHGLLRNPAPSAQFLSELIEKASDPRSLILAAWRTGAVVHRQVAIRQLARWATPERELSEELEGLLLAASLDAV